jgi:hypothetical protein
MGFPLPIFKAVIVLIITALKLIYDYSCLTSMGVAAIALRDCYLPKGKAIAEFSNEITLTRLLTFVAPNIDTINSLAY